VGVGDLAYAIASLRLLALLVRKLFDGQCFGSCSLEPFTLESLEQIDLRWGLEFLPESSKLVVNTLATLLLGDLVPKDHLWRIILAYAGDEDGAFLLEFFNVLNDVWEAFLQCLDAETGTVATFGADFSKELFGGASVVFALLEGQRTV